MGHLNVEIKAKCYNKNSIRETLKSKNADFKGVDYQIDTYFKVNKGRLKLREGNIENSLIFYERENKEGPKQSNVILLKTSKDPALKEILLKLFEVLATVDKKREIYFIDNVKFHIDEVNELGNFVEIEAIDNNGSLGKEKLLKQCQHYMQLFNIQEEDLISKSYSDMLLEK